MVPELEKALAGAKTMSIVGMCKNAGKTTGNVRHGNGQNFGDVGGKALFTDGLDGLFAVGNDGAQDAEVGGIGDGQRDQINAALAQQAGQTGQASLRILNKHRNLLDKHSTSSILIDVMGDNMSRTAK